MKACSISSKNVINGVELRGLHLNISSYLHGLTLSA